MIELRDGLIHASCVDLNGKGILIVGTSGSGKSSLALDLIQLGAVLVCDDQVHLKGREVTAVKTLEGMIEVRGVGLLSCPHQARSTIEIVVDLDTAPKRLPETKMITPQQIELLSGRDVPNLAVGIKLLLQNGRKT